ncbi:site-specific DNA-methyltransferase [Candidatus Nitrotoga fabula]|uniref:Type III restriction-modification system methylation subunit n=1 Tax=Candidatus Nitrotoga fabula TaxID=2182327 RepID=A0A916FAN5_9PROT|nr:site-specific DNA-methyltransferase [Candidatus Nitrotoga fabula]CAE6704582.1 Type III restriction-modification system methylation subunit [Candidatus Nitrotoga fabula]
MPILQWLTRETDLQTSLSVPYRLLEPVAVLSAGEPSENLLIHGDNLEALKALLPFYAGKVKCIYIDPPYNTKSAFEHYDDNLEHTQWLAMIYPRLELLRDLLAEDGSIWVSIDDNEGHYLKVVMDEVFGRGNFIANCIWQKKASPQANAVWLSDSHDHLFAYAKKKAVWRPNLLIRTEEANARYSNPDNDERGVWTSGDCAISLTGGQRGAQYAKTGFSENIYEITTPSGRKVMPATGTCWRFSEKRFAELVSENRIWFGKEGNNVPRYKRFLSEVQDGIVAMTVWLRTEVGDNQEAKREVIQFNNEEVFATPKPERLLKRILDIATKAGDLILDSFLGSGTTAAVAHKMGRRYIGIEMGEHCITHCVPRLKKVIEGEQGGISQAVNWQGGGGFRFYRLGEPVFDEHGKINPAIRFDHLASHIWFCETRTALDNPAKSPLLGVFNGVAYYLLYNGILGDKRPDGGNVLTTPVLRHLPPFDGPKVIYGESSRLGAERLKTAGITFKQTPYDIKAR